MNLTFFYLGISKKSIFIRSNIMINVNSVDFVKVFFFVHKIVNLTEVRGSLIRVYDFDFSIFAVVNLSLMFFFFFVFLFDSVFMETIFSKGC